MTGIIDKRNIQPLLSERATGFIRGLSDNAKAVFSLSRAL
jgi:hypothetical protein